MKPYNCSVSCCRNCQFYQLEGRRGGACQQLGVPVQGHWKSCPLAIPPFAPSWEMVGQADMLTVLDLDSPRQPAIADHPSETNHVATLSPTSPLSA